MSFNTKLFLNSFVKAAGTSKKPKFQSRINAIPDLSIDAFNSLSTMQIKYVSCFTKPPPSIIFS